MVEFTLKLEKLHRGFLDDRLFATMTTSNQII